eukprot:6177734-Pleurochrysis_carterae.AAC.1
MIGTVCNTVATPPRVEGLSCSKLKWPWKRAANTCRRKHAPDSTSTWCSPANQLYALLNDHAVACAVSNRYGNKIISSHLSSAVTDHGAQNPYRIKRNNANPYTLPQHSALELQHRATHPSACRAPSHRPRGRHRGLVLLQAARLLAALPRDPRRYAMAMMM